MSRVLLFVQTGEGRPKCVSRRIEWAADVRLKMLSVRIGDAFRRADRWWLVECENAEAGRAVISGRGVTGDDPGFDWPNGPGRILASGWCAFNRYVEGGQSDD